jgi:hypothetical protein
MSKLKCLKRHIFVKNDKNEIFLKYEKIEIYIFYMMSKSTKLDKIKQERFFSVWKMTTRN